LDIVERTERIALGDVTLSYIVAGEGPLVIAAHGFPDEPGTFRAQLPALVGAGFTVVLPTLRGYAPSSVPRSGRYEPAAVARDLLAIADHYSPDAPARIVGHDWGAVAAFALAAMAPTRVSHLVTMAVPHLRAVLPRFATRAQLRRSWYTGLFQLPVAAEIALSANDFALIERLWRDWSPGYRASADELGAVKDAIRGREGPVLAYYRAFFSPRAIFDPTARSLLAPVRVPSLHLHGVDDGCVGIECVEGAERFYEAPYELVRVEGAGHFLQRERPAEVNDALLAFLGR
jgi:pimeloyl-ACP methyl ester carboxylesterase